MIGENLGDEDKFGPALPQCPADDGFAFAVSAGRIDEIDSEVESKVEQLRRFRFVGRLAVSLGGDPVRHADFDRAKRNLRYVESSTSEPAVFHAIVGQDRILQAGSQPASSDARPLHRAPMKSAGSLKSCPTSAVLMA